jgi:hypothetical protein
MYIREIGRGRSILGRLLRMRRRKIVGDGAICVCIFPSNRKGTKGGFRRGR